MNEQKPSYKVKDFLQDIDLIDHRIELFTFSEQYLNVILGDVNALLETKQEMNEYIARLRLT